MARANRKVVEAATSRIPSEVVAIVLGCVGTLMLLSLSSYAPSDMSFNSSGIPQVRNWAGPVGSYLADALLQALGIGAFVLPPAVLIAGVRAMMGRRVNPGLREAFGSVCVVLGSGVLAHLVSLGGAHPYPPGGILGALLGEVSVRYLAAPGTYVVASATTLAGFALVVDGMLTSLGVRGMALLGRAIRQAIRWTAGQMAYAWTRRQTYQESRQKLLLRSLEAESWTFSGELQDSIAQASERGRQDGAEHAQVERQRLAARDEAESAITEPLDLPAEDPEFVTALELPPPRPGPGLMEPIEPMDPPIRAARPPPTPKDAREAGGESAEFTSAERGRIAPSVDEPQIVDVRPVVDREAMAKAGPVQRAHDQTFELPSPHLLDYEASENKPIDPEILRLNAQRLTKTLKDYGIEGHVREIRPGPIVTMYEYVPGPGIKISKIASLVDDLAMSMEALRVRIVAPIPGKGAVGIEIPNERHETVYLKEIVAHDTFRHAKSLLTVALGKDIEGQPYVVDLAKMPHLLVAGSTGAGKSVFLNAVITSLLFKVTPDQVRMIMVDPKMLELSVYEGIPHLLLPVVTDPKRAAQALRWAVVEMERRYHALSELGVRNLAGYNKKVKDAKAQGQPLSVSAPGNAGAKVECEVLPYVLVVVDELADLMMVASRDVEASIMRLAQMARASGIHLILATQRPSVDVITGVIKANLPTRVAFQMASKHDSRTILDGIGAENLLGRGDMLYMSPGASGLLRIHGAYVSEEEIQRTVKFWKSQGQPTYDERILAVSEEEDQAAAPDEEDGDGLYQQALAIVRDSQQASVSMIQRRLRIGYNRAARLVERMEAEGLVGPPDGAKPREVYLPTTAP